MLFITVLDNTLPSRGRKRPQTVTFSVTATVVLDNTLPSRGRKLHLQVSTMHSIAVAENAVLDNTLPSRGRKQLVATVIESCFY